MTFELSNEYKLGESWALTPAINYLRTHPWEQPRREDVEITRVKPGLTAMMQSEDFELVLGGEYYVDHARLLVIQQEVRLEVLEKIELTKSVIHLQFIMPHFMLVPLGFFEAIYDQFRSQNG